MGTFGNITSDRRQCAFPPVAIAGILQGTGLGDETTILGTPNYFPKWSATAPFLTSTSSLSDDGTIVLVGGGADTKGLSLWSGSATSANALTSDANRATGYRNGAAFGEGNKLFSWNNMAAGSFNYVDGKIATAVGNVNIVTANDSFGGGNRVVVGRRQYDVLSQGVDDPGLGIGSRAFVIVALSEGDISGFFPNSQYDANAAYVLATYGAGATSVGGNIYPAGMSSPADLQWAMHPYMILRGSHSETAIVQHKILKATFSGAGTKIYYDSTTDAWVTISKVYSSYAPTVDVYADSGGNGQHGEGIFTSTWGYGAHAQGYETKAWGRYSDAGGWGTRALGWISTTRGYFTVANSFISTALGRYNVGGGSPSAWIDGDPLFEIGNGTSSAATANAFTVNKRGSVGIGTATIGLIAGMTRYLTLSATVAGQAVGFELQGNRTGAGETVSISSWINNATEIARLLNTTGSTTISGRLIWSTATAAGTLAERLRLQEDGSILLNSGNINGTVGIIANNANYKFFVNNDASAGSQINSITMGKSAGGYPVVGYNFRFTAVADTYNYDAPDVGSMVSFKSGNVEIWDAPLGVAGAAATYTRRWQFINGTNTFQSLAAATIQTATGDLTLATTGGNGDIVLSPNGTGGVGIGIATPNAAALLQMVSTTKGFLPPQMTKAQRDAIGTPPDGLMLYQTDGTAGVKARVAGAWVTLNTTADP